MDYTYFGYTESRQIVKGKISASDERSAVDMLENVGYRVISLKPVIAFAPTLSNLFQARVKQAELTTFSRQLAVLLQSGVGIIHALELLQSQTPDRNLKRILLQIVHDIRGGKSLSEALAQHPRVFSTIYCKMTAVGEQTGALEDVLRSLADYAERQSAAMAKIKQAMTYPAIVFLLAIVVAVVMVTVLLPPLIDLFKKMGGQLPITTRLLIGGMGFIQSYGLYLLVGIVGLAIFGFLYSRTPNGRYNRDKLLIRLPLMGRLLLLTELARCCRSLSLLFKSGLPMPEIMTLTAQASSNLVVIKALRGIEQDMLKGQGLATPMSTRKAFLPLMVEMTRVGEETGNLDQSLIVVAENYEIEADRRTQTLLSMIEPVMTIMIGVGVGFLALSVFMPLYGALKLVGG
jgi:type IV pilus assembly protein PilC